MIIGITGTNGAGKGTVVEYLGTKGFAHYSVRDFLTEELAKRGIPLERSAMRSLGNELRAAHGAHHIIELLHARAQAQGGDAIIESVRAAGEAEFLKKNGAKLLFIDADQRIRYKRAVLRGSSTDKVDFATFVAQENREMASTDPWDMNISQVGGMADFRLENNGTLEELHEQVDGLFAQGGALSNPGKGA